MSKVTLQIVASLIDAARGVIYNCHMFIVQATEKYLRYWCEAKDFIHWFSDICAKRHLRERH